MNRTVRTEAGRETLSRASPRSITLLAAAILLLAVLHAAVSVSTHSSHVIHVILGGLYLLPIIAGGALVRPARRSLDGARRVGRLSRAHLDLLVRPDDGERQSVRHQIGKWGEGKPDLESFRALASLLATAEPEGLKIDASAPLPLSGPL